MSLSTVIAQAVEIAFNAAGSERVSCSLKAPGANPVHNPATDTFTTDAVTADPLLAVEYEDELTIGTTTTQVTTYLIKKSEIVNGAAALPLSKSWEFTPPGAAVPSPIFMIENAHPTIAIIHVAKG